LLDFIGEVLEEGLSLLVEVLREDFFPLFNSSGESFFDILGFKVQSTDLMEVLNLVYLILVSHKLLEFLFEVFELGVLGVESL
jgi:hypothetical protein